MRNLGPCLFACLSLGYVGLNAAESELNVGFNLTDGNSETSTLNLGAKSSADLAEGLSLSLGAEYNYGESENDKNLDNAKGLLELKKDLGSKWYAVLKADALTDDIAGVDYRLLVGPALGRWLLKDEKAELGVELGASFLTEKKQGVVVVDGVESSTEVKNDKLVARVAQNYKRQLSETAKTWQTLEFLPYLEDLNIYLLNFEIGIEAMITGNTSLRLVFQDRYDSNPAPGRDDNDISLLAGIGLKF